MTRSIAKLPLLLATSATLLLSSTAAWAADPVPTTAVAVGGTDHDKVVGKIGVGWYGVGDIPLGQPAAAGANPPGTRGSVSAPAVGARYWVSDFLGVDAALGLNIGSGGTESKANNQTVSTDKPSTFGLWIHGGVPLALANTGPHLTFLVTPELNVAFASGTVKTANQPDIDESGFLLNLGARAGAEIQFGFMGLPQLALEGSVGLYFQTSSWKVTRKAGNGASEASYKESDTVIATSSINQPWDFFRSNIAARYYFF